VARAFERWRPAALFLVETELWPRLILEAAARCVPVFCVSARVYPRDLRGYRAASRLIAPMLGRLSAILAQNDRERERFIALGAVPDTCVVAGNLKHVVAAPAADSPLRGDLGLGADERVVVWGSLHADELDFLPPALAPLAAAGTRLIVAPRHARSAAAVMRTAERHGWTAWCRSAGAPPGGWRLLVLDTVGELRHAYAMAEIAVIGGGFGRHGGHNLLEPLAAGVPVMFGPHTQHFADDARAVSAAAPDACVTTPDALASRLREWLADPPRRRAVGARQRAALADGAAIANRYVTVLSPWLRAQGLSTA
jgi:3-deoxy-D-manno-octulosonic-acid transferase